MDRFVSTTAMRQASSKALDTSVRAAGWLIAAALASLHAWMLQRYTVNFPYQDDYTQLLAVPAALDSLPTWGEKIAYVFSLSTEHRIATLRLFAVVQAKLGSLDFRTLIYLGNALAATAALLVVSRAQPAQRPWIAAVLAAFVFSPTNFVSQFWATGALAHFSAIGYAFGALFCLARRGTAWMVAALALAGAAAFTIANGIMVFPVAAAMLALTGRRRAAVGWSCLSVAVLAFYFVGYETPPGRMSVGDLLRHPFNLSVLWVAAVGSMAERYVAAVAFGALIVIAWGALLVMRRDRGLAIELRAFLGFLVLSLGAIAAGRAALGIDAVVNSRYRLYSELIVAITLMAIAAALSPRASQVLLRASAALALGWFAYTWQGNLPHVADIFVHSRTALDHYAFDGRGIYFDFPGEDFGDFMLRRARDAGHFGPARAARPPQPMTRETATAPTLAPGNVWQIPPHVDARSVSVGGFVAPLADDVALRLDGPGGRYTAPLATQRMFARIDADDWTIFWGASRLEGVAPGRYRVGYGVTRGAQPGVVWSDAWVDIR